MAKKFRHIVCITWEKAKIELHSDNIKREEGFSLSKSSKPHFQTLKNERMFFLKKHNLLPLDSTIPETVIFRATYHNPSV
jgi:hypothetical protein